MCAKILKLIRNPMAATPTIPIPIFQGCPENTGNNAELSAVPITIATNVVISSKPLARECCSAGSIYGTIPYLAGLNNVECNAIRNSTTSIRGMLEEKNAASPISIAKISNAFTAIITLRLEN